MPITDPRTCHHGGLLDFCPYCSPQRYWPVNQQPVTIAPGWACMCGRVFNPDVRECPYCPQQKPADEGAFGPLPPILPVAVDDPAGPRPEPRPFRYHIGAPCPKPTEGGMCGCGEDGDAPAGPCTSFRCSC